MSEIEETPGIIMGYVKWSLTKALPQTEEEVEIMIDMYMRSLVAAG